MSVSSKRAPSWHARHGDDLWVWQSIDYADHHSMSIAGISAAVTGAGALEVEVRWNRFDKTASSHIRVK
eukprot:CAMPEP_0119106432 /NCGR_PEP_ID=MMETSP1180-20130426/4271_1 /TAXON_ID=3052 ORGANISM="Chlamydomonas cf sp, Strain CCMP681" /NCGR_SAMPLE_ID=MMETSP1180 /ASSEMBLY_ACC=CAM_ASM_000741 /LENGTH=68 /DNA_ID=CAMNT_0007091763 /DNA_START=568 /DNA_END=774 /DNA_ORIENTATION=+